MGYAHAQYVRKLVHDGKLGEYVEVDDTGKIANEGTIVKLNMGNFDRWHISPDACDAYKERAATGGATFGQHAVRRMLFRFSTEHYSVETLTALLTKELGPAETEDGEFRWEFSKAWKGGGKKKAKTPGETKTVIASVVASLSSLNDDEDTDDEFDLADDEFDDNDEDDLDDVLS
jgi:hypothetical protein